MALISCPECGKQVSDKASVCPDCSFPLDSLRTDGSVKIKLAFRLLSNSAPIKSLKCTISDAKTGQELWSGVSGEIASFDITDKTDIIIRYKKQGMYQYEDLNAAVSANKRYQVVLSENKAGCFTSFLSGLTLGAVKCPIVLRITEVDVIDADA